jgi:putative hydrolase
MVPGVLDGIRIYKGAECNIVNDNGALDLTDEDLKDLDVVMVAMHPRVGYESQGEEKNTEVLIKAIANPHVNIIAHPGNPMYPISIRETVSAAKEHGVAIEINNSSFTGSRRGSHERCLEFAKEVKMQDWLVVIGSDSHISTMLGTSEHAIELIKEAGLGEKNIINTSIDKIEEFLGGRR